ncbi:MAG: glycosyltransferase [Desulfobacterales bacterium]|nr:glycosyltransferase [Desulfobacterales bacterium]
MIVTFCNPGLLRAILQSLLGQTLPCHAIIVFDNSADGATRAMVTGEFPGVRLISEGRNIGTAGGFHAGMAVAQPECDFILTLDDDVEVRSDAVEKLYLGFCDLSRQGLPVGAVRAVGRSDPAATPYPIDWFPWRGTLVLTSAAQAAGLPCRDYFMYAEDAEFSLRLAACGYRFYCIPGSKITEIRDSGKRHDRFFGREIFFYADDFRSYYAVRNFIHVFRKHRRHQELARTVVYGLKLSLFTALIARSRSLSRTHGVLCGFRDGFRGRLGINRRFLPVPPAEPPAEGTADRWEAACAR